MSEKELEPDPEFFMGLDQDGLPEEVEEQELVDYDPLEFEGDEDA